MEIESKGRFVYIVLLKIKAKNHEFPSWENKWRSTQISKEVDRKFKSPRYLRDCSLYDMNNQKKNQVHDFDR